MGSWPATGSASGGPARPCASPRSTYHYRGDCDAREPLRMRLRELAANRVRYVYRRLHALLRREGWAINAKS